MAKKNKFAACILLSIFLLTTFAALEAKPVNASKVAMTWGHLNNTVYPPDAYEVYWEDWVCNQINSMFPVSWSHQNAYWTYTTDDNLVLTLTYISNPNNGVTWATNFWVGDFLASMGNPPPYGHFGFYGYADSSNNIWDNSDVYLGSTYYGSQISKNYFTFIWTCSNGGCLWNNLYGGQQTVLGVTLPETNYEENQVPPYTPNNQNTVYGYYDTVYMTGAVGMPFAWTARTDMNLNGYTSSSGNYAYIGWETKSPWMKNIPPSMWTTTNLPYAYFPYYFYRFALGIDNGGNHGTIKQSLDYAAWKTFGYISYPTKYNFGNSILNQGQWVYEDEVDPNGWWYSRMRVYGNGDITLPY